MGIENPQIQWRGQAPYSPIFDDIYFSVDNGMEETRHVFIEGNDLTSRWGRDLACVQGETTKTGFVIFETGFGTGLNFCLTAHAFLNSVEKTKGQGPVQTPSAGFFDISRNYILHYISVEKYPLSRDDLRRSLGGFPEINSIAEKLVELYPVRMAGVHRLNPAPGVFLTLVFDDCLAALDCLYLPTPVDAWFLDGFSPARNETMWPDKLFSAMARFSRVGSTVSTFTAAGHVRRKLQAAGFEVARVKGFGGKRHMVFAKFYGATEPSSQAPGGGHESGFKTGPEPVPGPVSKTLQDQNNVWRATANKPWFYTRNKTTGKTVAIVGAGLAGCALAEAFARRNWRVELIDQNKEICSEASGNPRGIFFPVVHRRPTYTSRFSGLSYISLLAHLKQLVGEGFGEVLDLGQSGLLQAVENSREIDRFEKFPGKAPQDKAANQNCLDDVYEFLDSQAVKDRFGINASGGVLFNDAGFLSPRGLCLANLARHEKINPVNLVLSTGIKECHRVNGAWEIFDYRNVRVSRADVVVLANSWAINAFAQADSFSLQKIRGQLVIPPVYLPGFEIPVSGQTYMIPAGQGVIVGATHDRFDDPEVRPGQNLELIQNARKNYPDFDIAAAGFFSNQNEADAVESMPSRVSFRSAADDHFPVIGRLPDTKTYNEIFSGLNDGSTHYFRKNGHDEKPAAWHENLYCLTGLGSRGILYSRLGAEIIAAMANSSSGECPPLEKDLLEALSPARFLYRALKRAK